MLFKNPIIIGLIVGILVFIFFYWQTEQYNKKNPDNKKRVNFIIPAAVGILTWFILSFVMDKNEPLVSEKSGGGITGENVNKASEKSNGSESYYLVNKNYKVPIPATDVFIDIAKF